MDLQKEEQEEQQQICFVQKYEVDPKIERIMLRNSPDGCVWIGNQAWQQLGMPQVCKNVKQWSIKGLGLTGNKSKFLFQNLSGINFGSLKQLKIDYNRLNSFDFIHKIHMPELLLLDLDNNNFTQIKGLRKANTPKLKRLDFGANNIISFSQLAQINSGVLDSVRFKTDNPKGTYFFKIFIYFAAKMQTNSMMYFSSVRYSQPGQKQVLLLDRRFPQCKTTWLNFVSFL